jgi:hypothetical protein
MENGTGTWNRIRELSGQSVEKAGSMRHPVSARDAISIIHPFRVGEDRSTNPVRCSVVYSATTAGRRMVFSRPKHGCQETFALTTDACQDSFLVNFA